MSVLFYLFVHLSLGDVALATINMLKMGCYRSQSPVLSIALNGPGRREILDKSISSDFQSSDFPTDMLRASTVMETVARATTTAATKARACGLENVCLVTGRREAARINSFNSFNLRRN